MAKKRTTGEPVNITVVFVEGDADELLINKLLFFYRNKGWTGCCKIKNTHGFPDEKKMRQGLKSIELCSKKNVIFNTVCCEYDTDIFEKGIQMKPDWKKVESKLNQDYNVVNFCRIEAKTSIEDWMLDDIEGLLESLGLPSNTNPKGEAGQDKVKDLFRRKNIIYDRHKGKAKIKPVIDKLDISKIREARKMELKDFEKLLGLNIFNNR